ncbi:hypothetical protein CEE36_07740 [candidate division TA06 bacterium B3_TA06]|uniref:Bulb-type lectin domain-containing protein n=1 Tax=candidate division TA06 bacterium B3_TA06 TaxID=2012487 RepID=A0A532V461_UNCT6|nr:MAG: hypothetical protein CEE36_07740 [candidate division TA06 bacterium B3_TA06]
MKNLVLLVVLATTFTALSLQAGWIKTYGGEDDESGYVIQGTSDGGFVVFGNIVSGAGSSDIWLLKTDAQGDTLWTKTYGGQAPEYCYCGQQTVDGGYILAGYTESFGAGIRDIWLLKTDEAGDTLWTKTYGGPQYDAAYWVQQTEDGGYIITGHRDGPNYYMSGDMWLLKTDPHGDTMWTRTYGEDRTDFGNHVSQTSDGGYIIACYALYSQATSKAIAIMKTDSAGDTVWTYRAGSSMNCIQQTTDNAYVSAGQTNDGDLVLVKLDEDGSLVWEKTYGDMREDHYDFGYCVQETSDGCYIVAGAYSWEWSGYSFENGDAWLLKTDSEGDTLWTRLYGENPQEDDARWVLQTSDGGYILTGSTETWASAGSDLLLMKTNSEGLIDAVKEEPIVDSRVNWQIISPVGQKIVLRYSDRPDGFCAEIFDAAGRKVDQMHCTAPSGTLIWGEGYTPGVYFIREVYRPAAIQKVILIP